MSRWLVILLLIPAALGAGQASVAAEPEFKGDGLCQFALHGFVLPAATELAINQSVERLLERHQSVLGFQRRPFFRLRMRVYGRYEDFTNAPAVRRLPQAQGVYSPMTKEIVTWRQEIPGFLGTTLLHEASHAIMDAHYRHLPIWLEEGAAEYFAHALYARNDVTTDYLRQRWALLNRWLREDQLPPLAAVLNASPGEWRRMDLEKAYAVSWSIFQFLMSSDSNKQLTRTLLAERQTFPPQRIEGAEQIGRLYAGGLGKFESDWHHWIDRAGMAGNGGGLFHGSGLCQWAVQGCVLAPDLETRVNQRVQGLWEEYRRVFGFPNQPGFHVRIRLFGQAEEFARFATNWMVSGFQVKAGELEHMDGYYSPLSNEIVVRNPTSGEDLAGMVAQLANTAILREHWHYVPQWVRTGSQRCFVTESPASRNPGRALADAWRNAGLPDAGTLPWRALLNDSAGEWRQGEPGGAPRTQVLCWALFQFLSTSRQTREVLKTLMDHLQTANGAAADSAVQMEQLYPGGWSRFQTDFQQWRASLGLHP